jgi:hypothetical protein
MRNDQEEHCPCEDGGKEPHLGDGMLEVGKLEGKTQ